MMVQPALDARQSCARDEEYAVSVHRRVSAAWHQRDICALDQIAHEVERAKEAATSLDRARLDLVTEIIAFCRTDIARRQRWSTVLRASRALIPG